MTDYALDALKRKRAEMTGEIALCHARLQKLSEDLEHLDATLRMFAPDLGIPEDPATGSAAIGFAHVIQGFDQGPDGLHKRTIEQGLEMGRPSSIQLISTVVRGKLEGVRIGGAAVRVAEGQLKF